MSTRLAFGLTALALALAAGPAAAQSTPQSTQQIQPLVTPQKAASMGYDKRAGGPLIPVEMLDGVETVTLDTPRGPVVVISWPTAGAALKDENNINFSRVDANDDGYLTSAELDTTAAPGAAVGRLSSRFKELDTSGDNRLSFEEVAAWVNR